MKIIAFEEHYTLPAIADAHPNSPRKLFDESRGGRGWPPPGIEDLGEGRIAAMDAAGIDVQILSNVPGVEAVEIPQAVELARQANDAVVAAATEHPDRFLGFATLPMRDPDAAVAELERTVRDHGFVGALINGHVDGRYLDDPFFWPVFESAEALDVPIYLHPTVPPRPVIDAYYQGLAPAVSAKLAVAGLGWHIDTGIHCVRLILGGVFDRFPKLQVIVGHHFEALSWMAWRTDYSFPPEESGLKRTIKEYLRENFYGGILAGEFAGHATRCDRSELELVVQRLSGDGQRDRHRPDRVHRRLSVRQYGSRPEIPGADAYPAGGQGEDRPLQRRASSSARMTGSICRFAFGERAFGLIVT